MKYQQPKFVSIKQTRDNLADIIEQVSAGGKTFAVTKFGKVKALITPVDASTALSEDEKLEKMYQGLFDMRGFVKSQVTDASTTVDEVLYGKGLSSDES